MVAVLALLLWGCSAETPSTQRVPIETDDISLALGDTKSYFLHVERGWEVRTKQLNGDLMVSTFWDDGSKGGFGIPSGRPHLFKFSNQGLVEVRLSAGTFSGVKLQGLELIRPPAEQLAVYSPPPPKSPNILVYVMDTVRYDSLGCFGGKAGVSPNIDKFAADSVRYQNFIASSSWTRPSVGSLLTGVSPRRHGAVFRGLTLSPKYPTLAELLAARGYSTASFVTNPNLDPRYGFGRGFETVETPYHEASSALNGRLIRWLKKRDTSLPFFLFAHSLDPHHPYLPPHEFRQKWAPEVEAQEYFRPADFVETGVGVLEFNALANPAGDPKASSATGLRSLYDADVAFNDHSFGALVEQLKAMNLYESTLIVVVSDHGEEFFEHGGWLHGRTLHQEVLKVPLLVHYPGHRGAGTIEKNPATHADLFPTLLSLSGEVPDGDGRDLRGLVPGRALESSLHSSASVAGHQASIIEGDWKLIQRGRSGRLYNLATDPAETKDLAREKTVRYAYLMDKLKALPEPVVGDTVEIPDDHMDQLRALNYIK